MLGFVPNLHRLMSISPHVLTGWFGLMSNPGRTLDVKTRDSIALATSQATGCDYCVAAHAYVASTFANMSAEEIALNRAGHSENPLRAAAAFAQRVIETRGQAPTRISRTSARSATATRISSRSSRPPYRS